MKNSNYNSYKSLMLKYENIWNLPKLIESKKMKKLFYNKKLENDKKAFNWISNIKKKDEEFFFKKKKKLIEKVKKLKSNFYKNSRFQKYLIQTKSKQKLFESNYKENIIKNISKIQLNQNKDNCLNKSDNKVELLFNSTFENKWDNYLIDSKILNKNNSYNNPKNNDLNKLIKNNENLKIINIYDKKKNIFNFKSLYKLKQEEKINKSKKYLKEKYNILKNLDEFDKKLKILKV